MRHVKRETGMASVAALVVLVAVAAAIPHRAAPQWPTALVVRAPFADTVVESGTIGAERLMIYSSRVSGAQAKIVEMVPEGTAVKTGDLLIRFDSTSFEQSLAQEQAFLHQAEAELVRAREELRLDMLRADGELDAARDQVGHAESGLTNQMSGKGKLDIAESEAVASEAQRELDRARAGFEDLKPLFAEGFVTRSELDKAEQSWHRAEEQKRLADLRRETLLKYERPAATSRAESEVQTARAALAREGESVASRRAQREATVGVAGSRVQEIRARAAILEQQIANAQLRAEGPGLVVYRDLFFGVDRRKAQVGDEVWPNQPILAVPDSTQLTVDTRVRETDLHKVAASQRVTVTVDAYPDLRLPALVQLVGVLAQEDATRAGTKFFPVTVKLLAGDPRLRTGMTAQVEIEVATFAQALVVPVQAVFDDRGAKYVLVDRGGRAERQSVTLVGSNENAAAIRVSAGKGAVAAGDHVLLVDPAHLSQ